MITLKLMFSLDLKGIFYQMLISIIPPFNRTTNLEEMTECGTERASEREGKINRKRRIG